MECGLRHVGLTPMATKLCVAAEFRDGLTPGVMARSERDKDLVQRFRSSCHIGILSGPHPEEHRAAMRLEGWPQATVEQDAILRDTSLRPPGKGLFPGDEDREFETAGFMEAVV
jgi:hypothetical protein